MKNIKTSTLGKILKWALIFVFAFGLFFTPFCHWFFHEFFADILNLSAPINSYGINAFTGVSQSTNEYKFIIIEIYTLGIAMLGIVFQLIKICMGIESNQPFTFTTSNSLKNMALISYALVVLYFIKFVVYPRLPCLLIAFTFIIIGMISAVFSQLFKKAVEYKEENDFMI